MDSKCCTNLINLQQNVNTFFVVVVVVVVATTTVVVSVVISGANIIKYCAITCMQLKILKQTYGTRGYCIHL